MTKFAAALLTAATLTASIAAVAAPTSSILYVSGGSSIKEIQGNSIISTFATANSSQWSLNVDGDIRTNQSCPSCSTGSQYTLAGAATGVRYAYPAGVGGNADDGTTDGVHNFTVSYNDGKVYQMDRDFSNPLALFSVGINHIGITYDETNNSLWIAQFDGSVIGDYSMSGTLLSQFSTAGRINGFLALDHADQTLWLPISTNVLQQYSKTGTLLSTGINAGYNLGGEFDFATVRAVPEPGSVALLGLGLLGMAALRRRKA